MNNFIKNKTEQFQTILFSKDMLNLMHKYIYKFLQFYIPINLDGFVKFMKLKLIVEYSSDFK